MTTLPEDRKRLAQVVAVIEKNSRDALRVGIWDTGQGGVKVGVETVETRPGVPVVNRLHFAVAPQPLDELIQALMDARDALKRRGRAWPR
jgi:hypothetical protein